MIIKVIGAGCSSCSRMFSNTETAVEKLGLQAQIEFIHDLTKAIDYNILQLPALIVNEKVLASGRDLTVEEVMEKLQEA